MERSKASIESKPDLDGSLVDRQVARHLEAKRRILEEEFEGRETLHEARMRRQKQKKIGRMVR